MSLKSGLGLGLYEFLEDAQLTHYYTGLKNILQIQNVGQLKYVREEDLASLGMSKPEARRLRNLYNKQSSTSYASKLRKLLGRKDEVSKDEFLLGDEIVSPKGSIKVPTQHLIPSESVTVYKELGEGEFGVVQQGVWTDEDGMRHQVAVKCLSKKRMQNNTVEFMKEYEMMQSIDHNNIVRLYGVILDSDTIMLITELAPLRSLLECLREISLRSTFTVPCLAEFCQQICQGMVYLEEKRLIHRDLAARNILVFNKTLVKISDFGLSRALGVGKDYYQTNFNVNLKLPIAWCAPECINFLKFTSASDVWAFGVTMWEMFSYGFQPWAAMTGHQILEAIDEDGGQRLEKPNHCPRDFYQIMEATWRHKPDERPSFREVGNMLDDARPEQVQVIVPGGGSGLLQYNVGDILTVLDKRSNMEHTDPAGRTLWSGVNNQGKVGMFLPSHTVTYLGNLPASQASWSGQQEQPGIFTRAGLRSSKDRASRRKISRDMISGPTGQVQHTGHVGPDGAFFGDVTFIAPGSTNGNLTTNVGGGSVAAGGSSVVAGGGSVAGGGGRLPSTGSDNGFPSWKADSDASDSAPLLSSNRKTSHEKQSQPRMMGHAIGYLRKQPEAVSEPLGALSSSSTLPVSAQHQYQSISDEENEDFGSPLDLGPSLMDEVFSELENYDNLQGINKHKKEEEKVTEDTAATENHGIQGIVDSCHKFADKVTTMTISRKHKGKKAAFVRPINASDEKTLENAIRMANAIASKSMHDLDKRCTDDMFNASPQVSPITPNSPTKKFTFKFPVNTNKQKGGSHSPTRHFTDEVASRSDMNSAISPQARDAYKVLIDGDKPSYASSAHSMDQLDSYNSHHHNIGVGGHTNLASSIASGMAMGSTSAGLGGGCSMSSSIMSAISSHTIAGMGMSSSTMSGVGGGGMMGVSTNTIAGMGMSSSTMSGNVMGGNSGMATSYTNSSSKNSPSPHASSHRLSLPPTSAPLQLQSQVYSGTHRKQSYDQERDVYNQHSSSNLDEPVNPLPLPPKDRKSSVTSGGKRHTRKNPLIIPSGIAANMARRAELSEDEPLDHIRPSSLRSSSVPRGQPPQRPVVSNPVTKSGSNKNFDTFNDAFEEEIACNMDALDNLQEPPSVPLPTIFDTQNNRYGRGTDQLGQDVGEGDLYDSWRSRGVGEGLYGGGGGVRSTGRRGLDSDEVRIMTKVLGGVSSDKNDCLAALNISDWNIHKAIKIIKLKRLVPALDPSLSELKISLMNNDWDITKAATTSFN